MRPSSVKNDLWPLTETGPWRAGTTPRWHARRCWHAGTAESERQSCAESAWSPLGRPGHMSHGRSQPSLRGLELGTGDLEKNNTETDGATAWYMAPLVVHPGVPQVGGNPPLGQECASRACLFGYAPVYYILCTRPAACTMLGLWAPLCHPVSALVWERMTAISRGTMLAMPTRYTSN